MKLGDKQRLFTKCVAQLIEYAYANGYELTFGDAYRDPRVHGDVGIKKSYSSAGSVHKVRLAVDLNLFKNGEYLTTTEAHKKLGEYWEGLHPLCRWGGYFKDSSGKPMPDGNHYSMYHEGRA